VSVQTTIAKAIASIPDGALIAPGGFQLNRAPMALVLEIVRQGRRNLRVVSLPNPLPLDVLVAAGSVAEAEFGFLGFQFEDGFVMAPHVKQAIETQALTFRERDVYEIVQGLRAAAYGVPLLPAPGGEASDYMKVNRTPTLQDPETGRRIPVARAIRPDVALLHARVADRKGNLRIDDPYADDLLARASVRVIATAETIVERLEMPTIPHTLVEAVAEAPGGALPTSCHHSYGYSAQGLRRHIATAPQGRGRASGSEANAPRVGAADRLVYEMARCIADRDVVATGVASALPMLAIALARATHAPGLTYINCVGAVNPDIREASPTSVDPRLLDACEGTVTLPDMFDLARRGRIDLMFLGAAQVDAEGRANSTCIGDFTRPRVKLPGPAGSSSMRAAVPKVVIGVPRHSSRSLPERVDFATSVPSPRNQTTVVLTDLTRFDLQHGRLRVVSRREGVTLADLRAATGFPVEEEGHTSPAPTVEEQRALERLDPAGIRHRMI